MLGKTQTIDEGDKSDRERTMNKLSEGNEALFTDATANDHPEGRIDRLKDGDFCENLGAEDDADQKSITLEALKDGLKSVQESQRDRDFVSQSSLTIVSDSDLFLENSRWLNSSINDLNNHINNNSNNTITTNTSNNNNSNNIGNNFYNTRSSTATRRRSSLLSDVTFESDDQTDDIDAQTTDSNDSSWANNSALLATARRFAPNYIPGGNNNETIEEEHHDYHEKLKQSRDGRATTAAPVIPLRRVSASYSGPTYGSHNAKALRAMAKGNAAAPTIPKRTSSHHSNLPSIQKNNAKVYHMYNASFSSIVDSQISVDTEPSFFEDRSTAVTAAAAYLSYAAMASQSEEVRTVETAITSHTNDTPKFTNHGVRRRSSREEAPIEAEMPPVLPERRGSKADFPPSFVISSSFDDDDEDEIPSVVHEEEPQQNTDSAAAHPTTNTKTTSHAQPPSIPVRKNSGSQWASGNSKPAQHSPSSPSRLNTQPPTCPMRKESNHHIRRSPNDAAAAIPSPRIEKFVSQDPSLLVPPGPQPTHKHNKPPTKPTRTNSKTVSRSPASAISSS